MCASLKRAAQWIFTDVYTSGTTNLIKIYNISFTAEGSPS